MNDYKLKHQHFNQYAQISKARTMKSLSNI